MTELELEISPPPVALPAQAKVEELVEELRELGHDPTVVPGYEHRAAFQPLEIVIRLAEMVSEETTGAIVGAVVRWIRRVVRARRGPRPDTVKLYGPNGEVLREIEVDVGPSEDA